MPSLRPARACNHSLQRRKLAKGDALGLPPADGPSEAFACEPPEDCAANLLQISGVVSTKFPLFPTRSQWRANRRSFCMVPKSISRLKQTKLNQVLLATPSVALRTTHLESLLRWGMQPGILCLRTLFVTAPDKLHAISRDCQAHGLGPATLHPITSQAGQVNTENMLLKKC